MARRSSRKIAALQQVRELAQLRKSVAAAMRELRRRLKVFQPGKNLRADGEQREIMSELLRFAQVHVKVVQLEQELWQVAEQEKAAPQADAPMSEADWKLLQDAMSRGIPEALRSAGAD